MRAAILLLALALVCAARAEEMKGPAIQRAGCYATDDIKSYPKDIRNNRFHDIVKGNWVQQAYLQAQVRAAKSPALPPDSWHCKHTKTVPVRACYNSVERWRGMEIRGQYGFVFRMYYECPGYGHLDCLCAARLNTWRENRAGAPWFWADWKAPCVC